jgi:serine/threonine protein kinase/plasmid stabilization system protein ParE
VGSAQNQSLERIFNAAVEKGTPAERSAFLDGACGSDADLRVRIEALLQAHDQAGSFLDSPALESDATLESPGASEGPGTKIGRYKILQLIGEGGFGSVYMAEQEEPVRRKLALKIIKLGMDTKQVIARFEAERQALALMDHLNIARVLDAGATEAGRPYFVMELVRGISITEYCDKNKLATRERLHLFLQVCHAVQHAHQKGIIHRDLKPNNVLVTLHDSRAVPKVIDFGIAKATSQRLTEKTLFTEFRQFIGTPEYMSPDQAEISGLDVDTRTDIYSLGVLLYELLTGTTPFDATTLRQASYGEIQRIIREVEPPRPSTRVETLKAQGTDIATRRQVEPRALRRLMRGDLDWIVMKAIEKDRTRRYQTANDLARDIERHLNNEPVMAGPPSVAYKLSKFIRRHRAGVLAGSVVAAALVIGLALATTFYFQASRERDAAELARARADQEAARSQRIADFLQDLLVSTNPDHSIASDVDVEGVVATAREVFGDDHATVAATLSSHALQLQSAGEMEAAERLYNESLRIWRQRYGEENINVANTLRLLGLLHMTKGDDRAAERALRESIRITRALPGEETIILSESLFLLGSVLRNRGAYDEAEAALRDAVRIRRAVAPSQRLELALAVNTLANVLVVAGKDDTVEAVMPEVLEAWRQALPPRSLLLARVLAEIGVYYQEHDENETAERLFREALDIFQSASEPAMPYQRAALRGLYRILERRNGLAAMVPLALQAVDVAQRLEDEVWLQQARRDLADLCWDIASKPQRTREEYEAALHGVETYRKERPDVPSVVNTYGVLLYRLGRYEEALEALALSDAHYSQEHEGGFPHDAAFIAMTHYQLGHEEEARVALARLRRIMQDPEFSGDEEAEAFLAEAEALLGGSAAPTSGPGRSGSAASRSVINGRPFSNP